MKFGFVKLRKKMGNSIGEKERYIKFSDRAGRETWTGEKDGSNESAFYSYDHKFFLAVAGDARVGEGVRRGERR